MTESGQISKIDIKDIIAEIQRDIEVKGYRDDDISFSNIPVRVSSGDIAHSAALREHIIELRTNKNVNAYRKLSSNRIFGSFIILVKKIIRKLTKFYIEPIVSDQNHFNDLSAVCLQDIFLELEILKRKVRNLEAERGERNSRENSSSS